MLLYIQSKRYTARKDVVYMAKRDTSKAKFAVVLDSSLKDKTVKTLSITRLKTQEVLTQEYLEERGVTIFSDLEDAINTLCWNLNCCTEKTVYNMGPGSKKSKIIYIWIFD